MWLPNDLFNKVFVRKLTVAQSSVKTAFIRLNCFEAQQFKLIHWFLHTVLRVLRGRKANV